MVREVRIVLLGKTGSSLGRATREFSGVRGAENILS